VGMGEDFYITNEQEIPQVVASFRKYVENPMLMNIAVTTTSIEIYDISPSRIPIMMAERPIVLSGKWKGEKEGKRIAVIGAQANGEFWTSTMNFSVSFESHLFLRNTECTRERRSNSLSVGWKQNSCSRFLLEEPKSRN